MRTAGLALVLLATAGLACRQTRPDAAVGVDPFAGRAARHRGRRCATTCWPNGTPPTVAGGPGSIRGPNTESRVIRGRGPWSSRPVPHGIAVGGMLFLQVSPFWGWSTPQVEAEQAPGYTTVDTEADGVALEAETLGQQLLGIRVGGRPLETGEQIRIVYGAGPQGARADTYAERESRFWVSVDGDGDGDPRASARLAGGGRRARTAGEDGAHPAERRPARRDGAPQRRGPRCGGQRAGPRSRVSWCSALPREG